MYYKSEEEKRNGKEGKAREREEGESAEKTSPTL
jgi:hypothetical protein